MERFWERTFDLLEKSVLFSGVIALGMVFTAIYCVVAQIPMPDYFALPFGVVIGYFFSAKANGVVTRRVNEREVTSECVE